jgi:hypothetical protein
MLSITRTALRPLAFASALALLAAAATAQTTVTRAGADVLETFELTTATVQDLVLPPASLTEFEVQLVLNGTQHTLHLAPYSLRAPGFQLMVEDETGIHEIPAPPEVTFRGSVEGYGASVAAASLIDGQLHGMVALEQGGSIFGFQPVDEYMTAAPTAHVVYDTGDVFLKEDYKCGTTDIALDPIDPGTPSAGSSRALQVVEVAIDADVEFYNLNGSSTTSTTNDINNVMNLVDTIYQRDVTLQNQITKILIRTTEPDPYSTSSSSSLLGQFQNNWNATQGSTVRDVAHLFTGKNLSGSTIGVAYLSVICNTSSAYGLSQSRFTTNLTSRAALTAHELGHNWSAPHCSCNIMCSSLGGCTGILTSFSTASINTIVNYKNTRTCLSNPTPPVLIFLSPPSVQAFAGGQVTITGSGFLGADTVTVGSTVLTAPIGFTVVSDNSITFNPGTPAALGPATVTVSNGAGASNPLTLTYVPTSPPKLSTLATGIGGVNFPFNYGGDPGDVYALIVSFDDATTFPFQGYNLLLNNYLIDVGTLDAVGVGKTIIVPPIGALVGVTVYSQVGAVDESSGAFAGASGITASLFFL